MSAKVARFLDLLNETLFLKCRIPRCFASSVISGTTLGYSSMYLSSDWIHSKLSFDHMMHPMPPRKSHQRSAWMEWAEWNSKTRSNQQNCMFVRAIAKLANKPANDVLVCLCATKLATLPEGVWSYNPAPCSRRRFGRSIRVAGK